MNQLTLADRQLLVMAGFAAANHNLEYQANRILNIFPTIIPDPDLCAVSSALLLYGIFRCLEARQILSNVESVEAKILKSLFSDAK